MELALYCPNCGYYEAEEDKIGPQGDYYTSVSVGSVFGELLGRQFADWFAQGETAGKEGVRIVEAGAHSGRLAADILTWMRRYCPALFERLEYWVVEPSDRRRVWQRQHLGAFGTTVRWAGRLGEIPEVGEPARNLPNAAPVREIIFSNELLDALPVHRLGWDASKQAWFEWGVTLQGTQFVWTRLASVGGVAPPATLGVSQLDLSNLLAMLPDGFSLELCPAAEEWWREAASSLHHGKLLAIDYGLTADELFIPERKEGTLRAYCRHRASSDVLACPGEQDITAHVNFTALQAVGELAGLKTDALLTQAQFLTGVVARAWQAGGSFAEWTPERMRQFQTLTHPEHLGRSFRVLVQSRIGRSPADGGAGNQRPVQVSQDIPVASGLAEGDCNS